MTEYYMSSSTTLMHFRREKEKAKKERLLKSIFAPNAVSNKKLICNSANSHKSDLYPSCLTYVLIMEQSSAVINHFHDL